jgi:hypothetical protein
MCLNEEAQPNDEERGQPHVPMRSSLARRNAEGIG